MSSTPGEERTIEQGDVLRAEPLQVAGQLNLVGQAEIAPADLGGNGEAVAEPRDAYTVERDEEQTIAVGATRLGSPVEIGGQLNIAGQLEVTPTSANLVAERSVAGSGVADALGTGAIDVEVLAAAAGEASAVGTADLLFADPVIRRDDRGLAFQETEEVTVGWQEDESITLDTEAGGTTD